MKILHLIYTHGVAGAEKYLLDLLPGLKEYGINAEVICVCPHKHETKVQQYCDRLNALGIITTLLPTNRVNILNVAKKVNTYCKTHDIKVIHSHLFNSDLIAVAVKYFYDRKLLLLSTKHGYKESYFVSTERIGKIQFGAYYFLTRFIIRRIDRNITISKAISNLYYNLKLTSEKMPFIHHGISVDKKIIREESVQYRKSYPQLVIVGRLSKIKGHSFLFNAMPEIIKQFPAVQLLVMGEGFEKDKLERLAETLGIAGYVSFLGFQTNPYAFINESDIIVLPSLFEPFGLVYIEAFALQTPVVAFDVQASNEIIENGETGILIPAKNTVALAEGICSLLNDPEKQQRIKDNAYRRYQSHFNTKRMVGETAAWYQSIFQ